MVSNVTRTMSRLLGKQESEVSIPELEALDVAALERMNLVAHEQSMNVRDIEVDISQDLSGDAGGRKLNKQEVEEMTKLKEGREKHDVAATNDKIVAVAELFQISGFLQRP